LTLDFLPPVDYHKGRPSFACPSHEDVKIVYTRELGFEPSSIDVAATSECIRRENARGARCSAHVLKSSLASTVAMVIQERTSMLDLNIQSGQHHDERIVGSSPTLYETSHPNDKIIGKIFPLKNRNRNKQVASPIGLASSFAPPNGECEMLSRISYAPPWSWIRYAHGYATALKRPLFYKRKKTNLEMRTILS